MHTLIDAHELLAGRVEPLAPCSVPPTAALGLRLAAPVRACTDWPAADVSMMDGYAARSAELAAGRGLAVAFEVPAGSVPPPLPVGKCARIFTGAVLPEGADVVVPQEEVRLEQSGAAVMPALEAGAFVRRAGAVCKAQELLLDRGELVTPARLGMLVAVGPSQVRVWPRPRVGLVTTGTELLPPTEALRPGQIRDSNGPMLAALAASCGLSVAGSERVGDDLGRLVETLGRVSADVDLLVTSGGVSVGDYDLVPRALEALGAERLLHKVAVKPGKPILIARLPACWVVGLPGNPVSALVGWHLFVRPMAERLAGEPEAFARRYVRAELVGPAANRGERTVFAPVRLSAGDPPRAELLTWQGSHDIVAVAHADALAILEVGAQYAAGDVVDCLPLDGPVGAAGSC